MDVKEAVAKAKTYVAEVFGDDGPRNIGLEEIRFDDARDTWLITVGFPRAWDAPKPLVTALGRDIDLKRTCKVVHLRNGDGGVVSVTDRQIRP